MTASDPEQLIQRQLEESALVQRGTAESCAATIARAAEWLSEAFRRGGRLLLCGNGGSAADCQHLAAEFASTLNHRVPRPALGALALTADTAFLTASANDFGFERVFERQIEAHGRTGDVLLALSTSGNSANVLHALERARAQGLRTILLTGESGGKGAGLAEVVIRVPSSDTQRIQESHLTIGHILCDLVERSLFTRPG